MTPIPILSEKQLPRFFWVAVIVISFYAIVLLQFPLLNSVGYEFAVAISLILPWFIGPLIIGHVRSLDRSKQSFAEGFTIGIEYGVWLLTVPLVLGVLNVFIVRNCSLWVGILFYLLIPGVTVFLSVAYAFFCAVAFRKAATWYFLSGVVAIGYSLYLGYVTPQIYSYNLIYGFFPGFSYDEVIAITPTLLIFRSITIVVAFVFMLLASFLWLSSGGGVRSIFRWRWFPLTLLFVTVVCGSWVFRVELGFETSVSYLRHVLDGHLTTPHFQIWYARNSFAEDDLWRVAAEHEFTYYQVARTLQVRDTTPITSYIYPDEDTQYRMIGTRTTNIAKPWRREIHLSRISWEQTLRHELVHAMAGEFGMPVIRAHYNIGLVEGLATAIDRNFGNRTLHEYAEAIFIFGIVHHPEQLINPAGFAFRASTVSYLLMGSFCRYLIDRYGILRFKEIYSGEKPERVYNRSYEELIAEWQNFLRRFTIPVALKDHIEYYFDRPSIFAKMCARTVARLNDAGYRALEAHKLSEAKEYFLEAVQTSDNSDAYAGLIRTEYAMAKYDSVLALFDSSDSLRRTGLQPLALLHGNALWAKGMIPDAINDYRRLLGMDLTDRLNEAAALRLLSLDHQDLRKGLLSYFVSDLGDSVRDRIIDSLCTVLPDPVVYYLEAKKALRMKKYDDGITALNAIERPFGLPILNGYREELLGKFYFLKRQYENARMHFWMSLNDIQNTSYQERIDDWLDRCRWYSLHDENFLKGR